MYIRLHAKVYIFLAGAKLGWIAMLVGCQLFYNGSISSFRLAFRFQADVRKLNSFASPSDLWNLSMKFACLNKYCGYRPNRLIGDLAKLKGDILIFTTSLSLGFFSTATNALGGRRYKIDVSSHTTYVKLFHPFTSISGVKRICIISIKWNYFWIRNKMEVIRANWKEKLYVFYCWVIEQHSRWL